MSSTSPKPSTGAGPAVETYFIAVTVVAEDAEHRADAVDGLELAEAREGGLHVGLAGAVGDEDEAGLVAEPLLLHRADRHAVVAEHAGDLGQHARAGRAPRR